MSVDKLLNASEVKDIAGEVLKWINSSCPHIPEGVRLAYQYLKDDEGMSLHTLKGTVKRTEYVDGGYLGYYPFAIYLRDMPDSTSTRLACNDLLDKIGCWFDEQDEYPDIGVGKYINSINQVTNSTLVKRFPNGVEDYMATFELYFEKE